jgi:hypothetical protein
MDENIRAAEIKILTIKPVTVVTACNRFTTHGNFATVLKKLSGTHEKRNLHPKMTFWTFRVTQVSHRPVTITDLNWFAHK